MANEEHLKILKQGVEVWNEWRKANWEITPDLSNADLSEMNLTGINLEYSNLEDANLAEAILSRANLSNANLVGADLNFAEMIDCELFGAGLGYANFTGADLRRTIFSYVDASFAYFDESNLTEAYFGNAKLSGTCFHKARMVDTILIEADLRVAMLVEADLSGADLQRVQAQDAEFKEARFGYANLSDGNFSKANFYKTHFYRSQAFGTNFTQAYFTEACIENWNIDGTTVIDDINCSFFYRKSRKEKTSTTIEVVYCDRHPPNGDFEEGSFTKLFQEAQNTIDLIFREGLDWKAFAYSFQQVEVLHEDAHLEVRSIENKGDGVVIVKVATAPGADKAFIHDRIIEGHNELASKALGVLQQQLEIQGTQINQLLGIVGTSQEVQKLMAEKAGGNNYFYGNIQATNVAPHGNATGGVYNDFSNTQDLAQAAAQIQALLAQLQQQGQSPQDAQQQVANDLAEQAKQDPTTLGKLVMWGQKLGDATVTDVVKGVVKMALRAAGVPLP